MDEHVSKRNKLALDVLRLSRNTLLVNLRFLDAALNQLEPLIVEGLTLATDGETLAYDPAHVLRLYRDEREAVTRAYLHMVLHGVFRHMFVHTLVDHHVWDLACDIAAEYVIAGLGLKAATTRRELLQKSVYAELQKEIRQLTAEKIYRYYLDKQLPLEKLAELRGAFYNDDHRLWYMTEAERALALGRPVSVIVSMEPGEGDGNGESTPLPVGVSAIEARWSEISHRMQMDMETFGKLQGDRAGNLMQNLREVNREKYDYTAFLKKFAVRGEADAGAAMQNWSQAYWDDLQSAQKETFRATAKANLGDYTDTDFEQFWDAFTAKQYTNPIVRRYMDAILKLNKE